MRSAFASLVRLYLKSAYAPRGRGAAGGPRGADRRGAAARIAPIALAALGLLAVADLGLLSAALGLAAYQALKPVGLQGLLLLDAASGASLAAFGLGFATALSSYSMSRAESRLLPLPIRPASLLGAKLVMAYLAGLAVVAVPLGSAIAVYAIEESPPLPFYLSALASILTLPLVPTAICFAAVVAAMRAFPILRRRGAVAALGAVAGLGTVVALNVSLQSATARLTDAAWTLARAAGPGALVPAFGLAYPPARLAWLAMTAPGLPGAAYASAEMALGLAVAAGTALILGPAYAAGGGGFGEGRARRKALPSRTPPEIAGRRGMISALLLRELRLVNREPAFLLNGPAATLLPALVLGITALARPELVDRAAMILSRPGAEVDAMLAAAAAGAFLGSTASGSSAALSRDAKALPYLAALPIPPSAYFLGKLIHAFASSALGSAIGVLGIGLLARLPWTACAGAYAVSLAFSILAGIAGLGLDTVSPRLRWDDPLSAVRRNPNAWIVAAGAAVLLLGLAGLSRIMDATILGYVALFGGGFAILDAFALAALLRRAESTLRSLMS